MQYTNTNTVFSQNIILKLRPTKFCTLKIKPDLNQTFLALKLHIKVCSYILLLWGESTDAHSCGVRLDDPVNLADILRRHAEAGAHPAHRAVGRRHERIRSCNDTRGESTSHFVWSHLRRWCRRRHRGVVLAPVSILVSLGLRSASAFTHCTV